MDTHIKMGKRYIGEGEPCFIIAEAGDNHNGDVNLAKELIDVAWEAEADAVKFQTFRTEEVISRGAEKAAYQKETTGTGETQFEMNQRLELTPAETAEVAAYARDKGIMYLSSPSDNPSVDLLVKLNVPAFKIGSGEITNFPLLKYIAGKGKPVILSTGMANLEEIGEALEVICKEGVADIILLHCITSYPARVEDMNLRAMATLRDAFKLPVGLSDHSLGITVPIAAVAMGACVIEKHFTLDKNLPGPDHRASLEPDELKQMVKAIRDTEKALGDGVKRPGEVEEEIKRVARRSLVARVDIPQGAIITGEMLAIKRPGTGIEPRHIDEFIGKRARTDIKEDALITWDMIQVEDKWERQG